MPQMRSLTKNTTSTVRHASIVARHPYVVAHGIAYPEICADRLKLYSVGANDMLIGLG